MGDTDDVVKQETGEGKMPQVKGRTFPAGPP
jgi:hypothetical protein